MAEAHRLAVRIYYEDTDLAGLVYHANYLRFFERGRSEALRALGIDQARLKAERDLVFVVSRIAIDYRRPARFDEVVTVTTALAGRTGARAEMDQTVRRDGALLVAARVTVACMDGAGRAVRIPPEIGAALDRMGASV